MSSLNLPSYISPQGFTRLKNELSYLLKKERPEVVEVVSWAASNGDRSENGDYIYGKKKLREIDRRIRFLTKTIESTQVVDPMDQLGNDQIFFGATVKFRRYVVGKEQIIQRKNDQSTVEEVVIVGIAETDFEKGHISWVSPIAKVIIKCRVGDEIRMKIPSGLQKVEILSVIYKKI